MFESTYEFVVVFVGPGMVDALNQYGADGYHVVGTAEKAIIMQRTVDTLEVQG